MRKSIFVLILFFSVSIYAQDITYTNEAVEVVDKIEPHKEQTQKTSEDFSLHGTWTSQFRAYKVTGQGNKSLKDNDVFHSHALSLEFSAKLARDLYLRTNFAGSLDTQQSSSDNTFRLDNLLIEIYRPDVFSLQFGDINPYFSDYTLQQTLEGFLGYYNIPFGNGGIKIYSVLGQLPRDFKGEELRVVYGYRAEFYELTPGLVFGIDQIFHDDETNKENPQDVSVISFNGRWNISFLEGLELIWDLAHSFNYIDTGDNDSQMQDGWAIRTKLNYQLGTKGQMHFEYEEVMDDFVSPVASGAPDRRSFVTGITYEILYNLNASANYSYDRDNLDHEGNNTNHNHRSSFTLGYTPWKNSEKKYLANFIFTTEFGYTKRFDNNSFDSNIWDFSWGIQEKIGDFSGQFTHTLSVFDENIQNESDINSHAFQVELGYSHSFLEENITLHTRVYFQYGDKTHMKAVDERHVDRLYGWEFRGEFYKKYQLLSTIEYKRISRPGNSNEGEVYSYKLEAIYSSPLPFGSINASLSVEYNFYNYKLRTEEYDEVRVMGNLAYYF